MKQRRKSTFGRKVMKLVCTLLGLVLIVMVAGTAFAYNLLGRIHYVDPEGTALLSQEELDAFMASLEGGGGSSQDPGVEFGTHNTSIGGKGSGLVNILLIGQDRREGEGRTRSDSMILCTFNRATKRLTMTSFLRDLYVQIPGYNSNRLNAAYAAGGMRLLDDTLEQNFGIRVDGNVEVDFTQFAQIVDLLGGVEMELRQDEAEFVNYETGSEFSQGTYILNGEQALAYSRIRKLDADGDFSRTSRQRKVIAALVEAYRGTKLTQMLPLVTQVLPMITTDMSQMEIMGYALSLFPMLSDMEIVSQHIPGDGAYTDQTINGMAVLVADMDAARQQLEQTLMGG